MELDENEMNKDRRSRKQLLFDIKEASEILGGMKISTIRKYVAKGKLKWCEHLAPKPWYFTEAQLEDFINNREGINNEQD